VVAFYERAVSTLQHRGLSRRRRRRLRPAGGRTLGFERIGDGFVDRVAGSRRDVAGRAV
jgi:hypothetical protein